MTLHEVMLSSRDQILSKYTRVFRLRSCLHSELIFGLITIEVFLFIFVLRGK